MSRTSSLRIRSSQSGVSILETIIALGVLLTTTVGVMGILAVSMTTTEDHGHLAARAAEYAQDKMEQLISLAYGDVTTDTTIFPSADTGGTGLAVGGSSNPSSPVTGYVDYLDRNGNQLTMVGDAAPPNWFFMRVWQISLPAGTSNLKQISVTSKVRAGVGKKGMPPQATVTSLKSSPF